MFRNSQIAKPTRERCKLLFVREVRGVFQTTPFQHLPNFSGHLRLNGRADEERMWLEFLFGEGFVNSIQRRAGCFPMLAAPAGSMPPLSSPSAM